MSSHTPDHSSGDEHHSGADHDASHIAAHVRSYLWVGAALLVLTGVTVALSYVDFGSRSNNIIVGLMVASLKASLVAAIFMHLKGEKLTIWRFLWFTAIFVLGLFLLSLLHKLDQITGTDYSKH